MLSSLLQTYFWLLVSCLPRLGASQCIVQHWLKLLAFTHFHRKQWGGVWSEFIRTQIADYATCLVECHFSLKDWLWSPINMLLTVYAKKYAHGFCFAVLCCGYTLTDFPISIRLTSLALWQSNDCPSASKATLMNMDKYFMWIHYERLHNHNKAKHNKNVYIFLGIYCSYCLCYYMITNRAIRNLLVFCFHRYSCIPVIAAQDGELNTDTDQLADKIAK